MIFAKFLKLVTFLLTFTLLTSLAYGTFPQFQFSDASYPAGEVDVEFQVSSGTQVEFYIDSQFVQRQDIVSDPLVVELTGSIQDLTLPIGSTVTLRNNDPGRLYTLSIDGGTATTIAFGDYITYQGEIEGDVLFEDSQEGLTRVISVEDQLTSAVFEGVQDYMSDGVNNFEFIIKYPLSDLSSSETRTFSISHEKYSNDIVVSSIPTAVNDKLIQVTGYTTDASSPLFYTLNTPGPLANIGSLTQIELTNTQFNISITSGLREGDNTIRFITTDPSNSNIFNGEKQVTVLVDTIAPYFNYDSDFRAYTNERALVLNASTDASTVYYEFNGVNNSVNVTDNSVVIQLSLEEGENNLTITAVDRANNIYKEAKQIFFNDEPPSLIRDSLEPEELFERGEARFFFQKIEGQTDKPNVYMTVFSILRNARDDDGDLITCNDYESFFVRNLGNLDNDRSFGPEVNLNDTQVSLLSYIFKKEELTSDSNGNFDLVIGLQERDFEERDLRELENSFENDNNPDINRVTSQNRICFILEDEYGNVGVWSEDVTLDAGNTLWRPGEITTIPNTLYAAEIEQVGDQRSSRGQTEFGMIARFQYTGGGEVTDIRSVRINEDRQGSADSRYINPDTSRMNFRYDVVEGDLLVYIPVKIDPLGIEPAEYPEDLDLSFEMRLVYDVDDVDIPIDTINPVYFQTSINIERPLDHTKWLTPENLDDAIGFLNSTIKFTERLTKFTRNAAVVGVIACTGARFWYGIEVAAANALDDPDQKQERLDKAQQRLFYICDRVACTSSPQECGAYAADGENTFPGDNGENFLRLDPSDIQNGELSKSKLAQAAIVPEGGEDLSVLIDFEDVNIGDSCVLGRDSDGNELLGVMIDARYTIFNDEVGSNSQTRYETTEERAGRIRGECVPVSRDKTTGDINGIDLSASTGACYTEGAPNFDETRCWLPGLGSASGWDPSDNVIESLRCGCITDTYSHLNNLLKIQEGIKGCLEQAKVGNVKGSYCERLLSQAVCDIATNVAFKTLSNNPGRVGTDGEDSHGNILTRSLGGLADGDKQINSRYRDTILSQTGLGTDQIVNKVCLGALTGDFSVLTQNILAAVENNEVKPVFGPAFPESRMLGYNPLTGDVTIQYRFTYGVVSGGQDIVSKVKFICDKNAPGGDLCPDGGAIYSDNSQTGSRLNLRTLTVRSDEAVSDSIVVLDESARYKYNILELEHQYTLDGERITEAYQYPVNHKGELLLFSCYFTGGLLGAGSGISCDGIFTEESLISLYNIEEDGTYVMPRNYAFFEDNPLFVNLNYDVRYEDRAEDSQVDLDLVYSYACEQVLSGKKESIREIVKDVPIPRGSTNGNVPVWLFDIPRIGEIQDETVTYYFSEENFVMGEGYTDEGEDSRIYLRISGRNSEQSTSDVINMRFAEDVEIIDFAQGERRDVSSFSREEGPKYILLDYNEEDPRGQRIRIDFAQDVDPNLVSFSIIEGSGTPGEEDSNYREVEILIPGYKVLRDSETPNLLAPGSCDLALRLVPSSQSEFLKSSDENFFSSTVNDDDFILDRDLERENTGVFETTFTIDSRNEEKERQSNFNPPFGFEFTGPNEGETVCGTSFDGLSYNYINYNNKDFELVQEGENNNFENLENILVMDYSINVRGTTYSVSSPTFPSSTTFSELREYFDLVVPVVSKNGQLNKFKVPFDSSQFGEEVYDVELSYNLYKNFEKTDSVKQDSYIFRIDNRDSCNN